MTWIKTHWVAIAVGAALFFVGVAIGTSGESSKTTVSTETLTETVTNTETITNTVKVKVKPAGPSGTIPGTGTFLVGSDVKAGTYRASASEGCYWERMKDLKGGLESIIENDNADGPVVLQVQATDKAIKTNRCSTFHRIG